LLLVLPADHLIDHQQAFHAGIQNAQILAEQDRLVTFGNVPDKPETGYGYIRKGENLGGSGFCVSGFVEKPDTARAETYLNSGDYLWNSGMFMFRAQKYIEALERFQPDTDIIATCKAAMENGSQDMNFIRVDKKVFLSCPDDSLLSLLRGCVSGNGLPGSAVSGIDINIHGIHG
jgi:mannose-1-phosphate guanylyltransferase